MEAIEKAWFLESVASDGTHLKTAMQAWPFVVGREPGNSLVLKEHGLSRRHAELDLDVSGQLRVTDFDSTNGSFVNRERITGSRLLAEGDVLHFGTAEFRLGAQTITRMRAAAAQAAQDAQQGTERTRLVAPSRSLSANFVQHEREFMELLGGRGLSAAAQPIVDAGNGRLFAYELLGRCTHPELQASPMQLFHLAAMLDREAELSEAFRRVGVPAIAPKLKGAKLFVNTHPKETFAEDFFRALVALRSQQNAPQLVVEVHETAVVEVERMRDLAARLAEIGVPFAYDDFGAGQARLNELGDVPAHFVKFDMGLVRGIDRASDTKQRVVRDLVRLVLDLGSVPLAEGVETETEAVVCRQMGFQLVQGYLTGRPVMVSAL